MIVYPTLVYRCPGNHKRPGGTFNIKPVKDDEEFESAIDNGWFETLEEAIKDHDNPPKPKYIKRGRK